GLHATIGALAALRHRDRTGEGQVIDCSLLGSALTMVEIPSIYYLHTWKERAESGRPPYRAKDGWLVISAVGRDRVRKRMAASGRAGGHENFSTDPITSSIDRGDDRRRLLEHWCAGRSVSEITQTLLAAGIPVGPVRSISEVTEDSHVWQ